MAGRRSRQRRWLGAAVVAMVLVMILLILGFNTIFASFEVDGKLYIWSGTLRKHMVFDADCYRRVMESCTSNPEYCYHAVAEQECLVGVERVPSGLMLPIAVMLVALVLASIFYYGGLRMITDRKMDDDDAVILGALMLSFGNAFLLGILATLLDLGILHYTMPHLTLILAVAVFIFPWGAGILYPILSLVRRRLVSV